MLGWLVTCLAVGAIQHRESNAYIHSQAVLIVILAPITKLGFVLGKAYYRKENYTDLDLPVAVNRIKEMLTKVSGMIPTRLTTCASGCQSLILFHHF